MGAKGLHSLLLILVLSWMVVEMEAARTFKDFKHDNVDYPEPPVRDDVYCTAIMHDRGLDNKKDNVFIHASDEELLRVCKNLQGKAMTRKMYSFIKFKITLCKALGEISEGTYDNYYALQKEEPLLLQCVNGKPVKFLAAGRSGLFG